MPSLSAGARLRHLIEQTARPAGEAWVHVSLADLLLMDGSSALLEEWTAQVRAQWAGHRAAASAAGGDGAAWLDGDAARTVTCDAALTPVVTGDVNLAALDDLVQLCVQLDQLHRRHDAAGPDLPQGAEQAQGQHQPLTVSTGAATYSRRCPRKPWCITGPAVALRSS